MEVYTPRWLRVSILVVALIGFLDAMYLTANHYLGVVPPCFVVQGCEQVTTSSYALILGIPVALLGAIYYLVIFALALRFSEKKQFRMLQLLHLATAVGFIMSLWFLYAQAFIIKAWCMYCLGSAGTSILLVTLGALAIHKKWTSKNSA
jgi:uncharacterized membrane protein